MAKLTFLGSASALPDEQHENTHFVIQKGSRTILVDCAASAFVRLAKAGISAMDIEDIILTHFHPDHVSGMPMLLMGMWLAGRRHKINLYGLSYTLERMKTMWICLTGAPGLVFSILTTMWWRKRNWRWCFPMMRLSSNHRR